MYFQFSSVDILINVQRCLWITHTFSPARCHHVEAAVGEDIAEERNPSHRCPQQGAFKPGCLHDGWETYLIFNVVILDI